MNEELQKALVDLLKTTLDAKEFLIAELPESVMQLMRWRAIVSAGKFVIGIALIVSVFLLGWGFREQILEIKAVDFIIFAIFIMALAVIFVALLVEGLSFEWLQILIAPKAWLVEYAAELVRSKQ